jgi:SAM-dependent methyltransferase
VSDAGDHPYDRHVGRFGSQLAACLIELTDVAAGQRVLDVGCGTGQLTAGLAAIAGGENVAALDSSEAVVEVCRSRVPEADVRVGSAEALPFADRAFDAALAQLVVNLVGDPPAAVREMARVTCAGGRVAACVWDDLEMPLLRAFWDAAAAVAPAELAEINEQARIGLPDPNLLVDWWEAAGLSNVSLGECEVTADYDSFDDLWFSFDAGVGHSGGLYRSLDSERRIAVRDDAHRRLGSPQGSFQMTAKARTVRGVS